MGDDGAERWRSLREALSDDPKEACSLSSEQLKVVGGGFDHNFVLRSPDKGSSGDNLKLAASFRSLQTRLRMDILTTEAGLQFYSGNFMKAGDFEGTAKGGAVYNKHAAFCVETQNFPDCLNQRGACPSPFIKA